MPLPESWSIKARAHKCSITGRKFQLGELFHTAIFPHPEESGYLRMDFCDEAWNDREDQFKTPFSFWQSHYEPPVAEVKVEVVTKESAEEILSRLIEEDAEHTENARYILALMLERKKLLIETDTQQTPTSTLRIYQHRHSKEIYIIRDPNISLNQLESIQTEVSDLLDGNADSHDSQ